MVADRWLAAEHIAQRRAMLATGPRQQFVRLVALCLIRRRMRSPASPSVLLSPLTAGVVAAPPTIAGGEVSGRMPVKTLERRPPVEPQA